MLPPTIRLPPSFHATQSMDELLEDDSINEIMINGSGEVYIERKGKIREAEIRLETPEALNLLVDRLVKRCESNVSEEAHIIDGILPNGNRINIALPPVSVDGPSISIRKFPKEPVTLYKMVDSDFLSAPMAAFLKLAMANRLNILIAGNTSSGKTTLLNALSAYIAPTERIVTIEDTPELRLQQKNVVRLEAKNAYQSGQAYSASAMRHVVRSALRMRPDRLVIGEVRGAEAFDLLQAMNTGHEGCIATLHANSPREVVIRLEHLINMADLNLSARYLRDQLSATLNLIIQTKRDEHGHRRITHITEVVGLEGDVIVLQDRFVFAPDAKAGTPRYLWSGMASRHRKIQQTLQEFRVGEPPIR